MTRPLHLSYSAIASFKACPIRYKNAYDLGIRPIEEKESQRIGSNWHRILDIVNRKPGSVCTRCAQKAKNDPECSLCAGTGFLPEDIMEAVVRELNRIYADKDLYDKDAAEIERIKLLYALCGYRWRWQDELEEVLGREEHFELPLINPETGKKVSGVKLVGCIDKFIRWNGLPAIEEHKSTSSSLDSDSTYWGHLNLDTQTTLYIYAAQQLQKAGDLIPFGIKPEDPLINTIIYDVWHKPTISPKKLTQAESKQFVEDGMYCGHEFEVRIGDSPTETDENGNAAYFANDTFLEIEPGKKEGTFAIRETPEMYGARLLQDITERPDFYFARRELNKTDEQIQRFEHQLFNIYSTIKNMKKTNGWYQDESQCEATFKCDYIESCYNNIELTVDNVPTGMKLIFGGKE